MKIIERDHSADRLALGDRLLIGNGAFGYRGTLDEHRKSANAALTTAGFYDKAGQWREPVNMPNPLYTGLLVNGKLPTEILSHEEGLDLSCGTYSRKTVYAAGNAELTVESRRFFCQTDHRLLYGSYRLSTTESLDVAVLSGIDCNVWNICGKHFEIIRQTETPTAVFGRTTEGKRLTVALHEKANYSGMPVSTDGIWGKAYRMTLNPEKPFEAEKCAVLIHEGITKTGDICLELSKAEEENRLWWEKKWQESRVLLGGSAELQLAMDYSIYQLISYAPKENGVSISARGLSGQTYKGAVFWDTEMFMLPFYTVTDPEVAERLVRYRIQTLEGAKEKARSYGFEGAFYAWESHEKGQDACSDFNVVDVFTGRPVRTYFKDKQIHISADVAVAVFRYMKQTGRWQLLGEGALELLFEAALFYLSYAYYNVRKGRYELLDVIGPDEYHERVNNNAYTNYMAHETAKDLLDALKIGKRFAPKTCLDFSKAHREDIEAIRDFMEKLYLPQPNEKGIIEQFDGYEKLEDVSVDTVRSRLVDPQEYWGGSGGVATATKVIKQADVVTLMCVLPERFSKEVKTANYDYYLPYTEHGSSLSASMYGLCACMIGRPQEAYELFCRTATVDLTGGGKKYAGKIYIGGTHPASCGGAWMMAALGFAKHGLPPQIQSVKIKKRGDKK